MGYTVSPSMETILFSGNANVSETRCWNPFARCPLTRKLMFGRKCTKLTYWRMEYSHSIYVDTNRYAYELITYQAKSDIPLPPSFRSFGRRGPRPGY